MSGQHGSALSCWSAIVRRAARRSSCLSVTLGTRAKVSGVAITVVLVDDHELIREGLRRAFERTGDFTVVGEAGTVAEAFKVIADTSPDVTIFDVRLPDGGALEAGASAFVPKDAPAEDVIAAARHAAVSPRAFTASDLAGAMQRRLSPTGPQLSPREKEVLRLLADGLGVAGISKQLFISESTTETHISKVYEKLGAGNRAQALMTAMRLGLIANPAENPR